MFPEEELQMCASAIKRAAKKSVIGALAKQGSDGCCESTDSGGESVGGNPSVRPCPQGDKHTTTRVFRKYFSLFSIA